MVHALVQPSAPKRAAAALRASKAWLRLALDVAELGYVPAGGEPCALRVVKRNPDLARRSFLVSSAPACAPVRVIGVPVVRFSPVSERDPAPPNRPVVHPRGPEPPRGPGVPPSVRHDGGQPAPRHFYAADGAPVTVREIAVPDEPWAHGPRCLLFEREGTIRRVWKYPAGWADLPDEALDKLSWSC